VAGGRGTGAEMVGREAALQRGAGAGSVMERGRASQAQFENGRLAARQRGREGGGGSGHGSAMWHGTTSWGLAPTSGRRPDRVPVGCDRTRHARAARRYSDSGALALTWVGPGGSRSGEA
jgi:hypothetical protein